MSKDTTAKDIVDAFDIEDFLSWEGYDYKITQGNKGKQVNVKSCPDCGDEKWRVYFNAETGLGNCFHCDKHYNKWAFAASHYNMKNSGDVFDMLQAFVKKLGWRPKKKEVKSAAVEMDTENVQLPSCLLPLPTKDGQNLQYLEDRGISKEYAKYFNLYFCFLGGRWSYIDDTGRTVWVNFEDRVIIPVFDIEGKLVTFQGRDITGNPDKKKYLFPSRLPGTGRYLYNAHNALAFRAKEVILNEGATDVFATKIALDNDPSIKSVIPVGSFGKNLSFGQGETQLNQFRRLKRAGLQVVTIMWDGEPDALRSALDAADHLVGINLSVRIALLPKDKDPGEVGGDVVRRAWREAKPYTKALAIKYKVRNPYE